MQTIDYRIRSSLVAGEDTHCSLVEEMMEHVVGLEGFLACLLVAEDEVDPLVKVCRHVVTLESLQVYTCTCMHVYVLVRRYKLWKLHVYTCFNEICRRKEERS